MAESTSQDVRHRAGGRRRAISGGLVVLAALIGLGILAAAWGFRLPVLRQEPPRLSEVISQTIETQGIAAAVVQYQRLRQQGFPDVHESESDTNSLGYRLLRKGEKENAIRVFQLNVETHPQSANVYDSLGEAYLAAGERALALENYRKALEIDPKMKTAVSVLQQLTNSKSPAYRPLVLFHICAGTLALLSGAAAMALRKGSRRHGVAGNVFFVSMLSMSSSAVYMASTAQDGEVINVLMGVFTLYLVATAWIAARRRHRAVGLFDWGAVLVVAAVAAGLAHYGWEAASSQSGTKGGISAGLYFFFGAVALLAAGLDLRMIVRGGVSGAQRIARHLWRMCFAMLIAVMSLFLGQPQVFPDALRHSGLLPVPGLLVVVFLVFWLIRVLFTKRHLRTAGPKSAAQTRRILSPS